MRVRISYGVDIEDVPNKVSDLIHESLDDLKLVANALRRALEDLEECEENVSSALKSIDQSRIKLSAIDLSLSDVQAIVQGLEGYYNGEQDVSEGRPIVDPGGNTIT